MIRLLMATFPLSSQDILEPVHQLLNQAAVNGITAFSDSSSFIQKRHYALVCKGFLPTRCRWMLLFWGLYRDYHFRVNALLRLWVWTLQTMLEVHTVSHVSCMFASRRRKEK